MVNRPRRGKFATMRLTAFLFWFVLALVLGGSAIYIAIAAGGG